MRNENELLKRSAKENEMSRSATESENKKLKKMIEDFRDNNIKSARENATDEIGKATVEIKNASSKARTDILDTVRVMKGMTQTVKSVTNSITTHYYTNYIVMGVFIVMVGVVMWVNYGIKTDISTINSQIQIVEEAVTNPDGWSVLNGATSSEAVWSSNHPDAYQRYLQKKQEQEEL